MDKKIGGFGFVCCLGKHTYVQFLETEEGEQYLELDGFKSRKVPDIEAVHQDGTLVVWELVAEVEELLKDLYLRKPS